MSPEEMSHIAEQIRISTQFARSVKAEIEALPDEKCCRRCYQAVQEANS